MPTVAIVTEGPDDVSALRALFQAARWSFTGIIGGRAENPLFATLDGRAVSIWKGSKPDGLAQRAIEAQTASHRPDIVAVCFDPDEDPAPTEFQFFRKSFEKVRGKRAEALSQDPATGQLSTRIDGRSVQVVPAPWRLQTASGFDGLGDEQNLERVLISGVLQALKEDPRLAWAEKATSDLFAIESRHGWKRAFRIWNAALWPRSDSFVDGLLQEPSVKAACLASLQVTEAWRQISALL